MSPIDPKRTWVAAWKLAGNSRGACTTIDLSAKLYYVIRLTDAEIASFAYGASC
jgi:hypothetical protein